MQGTARSSKRPRLCCQQHVPAGGLPESAANDDPPPGSFQKHRKPQHKPGSKRSRELILSSLSVGNWKGGLLLGYRDLTIAWDGSRTSNFVRDPGAGDTHSPMHVREGASGSTIAACSTKPWYHSHYKLQWHWYHGDGSKNASAWVEQPA